MKRLAILLFSAVVMVSLGLSISLLIGCGEESAATTARAVNTTEALSTTLAVTTATTAPTVAGSPLEIVSVDCNAPGDDSSNLNEEYVTFKVLIFGSLLGYAIQDESGSRYELPNRVFSAGQIFRLHTGSGTDNQTDLYWGSTTAVWNNGSDTVMVLDPTGRVVINYLYFAPTTED